METEQKYFYSTNNISTNEDLKYFRNVNKDATVFELDTSKYVNAINAYRKSKGHHYTKDEDYDDSIFEGLTAEDYAKKYPIHYSSDGMVKNFKD